MLWSSWFWTLIDYRWWCGSLQIWWKILTGFGFNWISGCNIQSIQWVCILFQFSVTYRSQLLIIFAPLYRLGHYTIPEEMDEVCAWLTSKLGLGGRSPWFDVLCIHEGFAWREKTEAENIQRHKQNKVAKCGSGHVIHVIQCSLWQVGTRVPRSWVELHFLS